MKKLLYSLFVLVIVIISFSGCRKDKLEIKPNNSQRIPETVQDFLGMMDNDLIANARHPYLLDVSADDYYVLSGTWSTMNVLQRNAYIWLKDVYQGLTVGDGNSGDWDFSYQRVFYSNVVLEGLQKLSSESGTDIYKLAKGIALFQRAFAYWKLAQTFCKPYSPSTASTDLGLPLRVRSDVLEKTQRSTVQQTYDLMVSDLKEAIALLPEVVLTQQNRPTKKAAFALLSRVYLCMKDYDRALQNASSALTLYATLLDYNLLNVNASFPIVQFNAEVLFQARNVTSIMSNQNNCLVDTNLYKSYASNDLRKVIFFKNNPSGLVVFKGGYNGSSTSFSGVANDEVYLIRAECYARKGQVSEALNDLNTLLIKRWKNGTFIPLTASSPTEALSYVLKERRKELLFRGLRWADLRRLNLDGANITLTRIVNGQTYTLAPNDPRYVFPIPLQEMLYNPMTNNTR
jgi:starch-binding outer membrane protein, SusD/RagB family